MFKNQEAYACYKFDVVDSTMDSAKKIVSEIKSLNAPFFVMAKRQVKGRGRQQSQWIQASDKKLPYEKGEVEEKLQDKEALSNKTFMLDKGEASKNDSLETSPTHLKATYYSHVLESFKDEVDILPLTLVMPQNKVAIPPTWLSALVGTALYDALFNTFQFLKTILPLLSELREEVFKEAFYLKWPNDLLFFKDPTFSKISGILIETASKGNDYDPFYIGIGLNLFEKPNLDKAHSFIDALVDLIKVSEKEKKKLQKELESSRIRRHIVQKFVEVFLEEIHSYLSLQRPVSQIKRLVLSRSLPLGTHLSFQKGQYEGAFQGLSDEGALLLEGHVEPFYALEPDSILLPWQKTPPEEKLESPYGKEASSSKEVETGRLKLRALPTSQHKPSYTKDLALKTYDAKDSKDSKEKGTKCSEESKPLKRRGLEDQGERDHQTQRGNDPKLEKYSLLTLDFGNSRCHMSYKDYNLRSFSTHLRYKEVCNQEEGVAKSYLSSLLETLSFSKPNTLFILYSTVAKEEKKDEILNLLKSLTFKYFPSLKLSFHLLTEHDLLKDQNLITHNVLIHHLGADRALKVYYAHKKAKAFHKNVLMFSLGTAFTCEGVSPQGELLESLIMPGINMALETLHQKTALLPFVSDEVLEKVFTPDLFILSKGSKSSLEAMVQGVFYEKLSCMVTLAKKYRDSYLVLSSVPNYCKDYICDFLNSYNLEFEVEEFIENKTLMDFFYEHKEKFMGSFQKENLPYIPTKQFFLKKLPLLQDNPKLTVKKELKTLGPKIEKVEAGQRIDIYLAKNYPFLTRKGWQKKMEAKEVFVCSPSFKGERRVIKPTYPVKIGDEVWISQLYAYDTKCEDQALECIYDNKDIVAFSKPPHLVIHAVGMHMHNTLLNLMQKKGYKDCYPVHRIDKETSGAIICARKIETRQRLTHLLATKEVKKMYLAITKGPHAHMPSFFEVNAPIGCPTDSKIRLKLWVNGANTKEATTHFMKLSSFEDYALFACFPKTGRTNQIRIHLASIGAWIVGDKMYHPNEEVFIDYFENGLTDFVKKETIFDRHLLHNTFFQIEDHENIDEKITVIAPPFKDMKDFFVAQELFKQAHLDLDSKEQFEIQVLSLLKDYEKKALEPKVVLSPIS
jgi:RluA family pseudouridine synthase